MKNFAVLSLAILCASCASSPWQDAPLPPKQIVLKGFLLTPPAEPGWQVNTRPSPDLLSLAKRNHATDPYENYAIQAYVLNIATWVKSNEDFLRAAKEGKAINGMPQYKILKQEINPHMRSGEYCVLSHVVAEDHGKTQLRPYPSFGFGMARRLDAMIFEEIQLTCRHPQNKGVAIDLAFSLRYYPGEGDSLFSKKAMRVVDSVEFTAP